MVESKTELTIDGDDAGNDTEATESVALTEDTTSQDVESEAENGETEEVLEEED